MELVGVLHSLCTGLAACDLPLAVGQEQLRGWGFLLLEIRKNPPGSSAGEQRVLDP